MNNWVKATLSDVLSNEKKSLISGPFGSDIGKRFFVESGIPVIRGNNLTRNSKKFVDEDFVFVTLEKANELNAYAVENDLIFTAAGTIGQVGMIPEDSKYEKYIISNKQIRARLNVAMVDHRFAYYWFSSPWIEQEIINKNTGSTVPLINLSVIRSLPIHLPALPIQRIIASVLSSLDEKIELNNKINSELDAMVKTLFEYWFVQFDFPDDNENPYKSSGGKMVYNQRAKQEIPEGWEVKSLGDLISTEKNGDWGKDAAEGNYTIKVVCIRGTDINGINGKGDVKTPTRFILEKSSHKILETNDLIIEISGGSPSQSTGRLACITTEVIERFENPLICSNFCKAISLKSEEYFFYFVSCWNKAYENGVFFGFEGKTSGIKNLLFEALISNYTILLPTDNLLKKFQAYVSVLERQKQMNLKQGQKIAGLRSWLLPMLMNGRLSVRENNRPAGEAIKRAKSNSK